jgi:hypothetical protein
LADLDRRDLAIRSPKGSIADYKLLSTLLEVLTYQQADKIINKKQSEAMMGSI